MEKVLKIFTTFFMLLLVFILTASVIFRYVFNSPISFAEESSRYILVWMSFLGAGLAAKWDSHMRVDAFLGKMPKKAQLWIKTVINLVTVVFLSFGVYYGMKLVIRTHEQVSELLRINMSIMYFAVVAGFAIMIGYLLRNIYITFFKGQSIEAKNTEG